MSSLLAYDADGAVRGTLDVQVEYNPQGRAVGVRDFTLDESNHIAYFNVAGAKGSKSWPVAVGPWIVGYRVELSGNPGAKQITALVHASGHRIERDRPDEPPILPIIGR